MSEHPSEQAGPAPEQPDSAAEISEQEVDALLHGEPPPATPGDSAAAAPGQIRSYDLVAPDKITRGRMPTLDRINERWVGDFRKALEELIRRPLDVAAHDVQVTRYGDWLAAQPSPSSLNVLSVNPWRGSGLVAIDVRLLYLLVDSFFGGAGMCPDLAERSALTPTEERLNGMLVDLLTTHFSGAFAPVANIQFTRVTTEINPHYATIATPSEAVVVSRLGVQHQEEGGELSLVLPLSMLEPVRERLDESLKTGSAENRTRWFQALRAQLEATELDLCTVFVESRLSMRELLRLKPGDILPIEMPKTATLYAGSRPLFRGKFGRSRGYNALKVIEPIVRPNSVDRTEET